VWLRWHRGNLHFFRAVKETNVVSSLLFKVTLGHPVTVAVVFLAVAYFDTLVEAFLAGLLLLLTSTVHQRCGSAGGVWGWDPLGGTQC
jgi:hypothetical protein